MINLYIKYDRFIPTKELNNLNQIQNKNL